MRRIGSVLALTLLSALLVPTAPAYAAPPSRPGVAVSPLGTGAGCIIQSSFGTEQGKPGNFEVVVLEGNELVHYWHPNSDTRLAWRRGLVVSRTATGPGCIIQSSFGTEFGRPGNLEVVVQEGSRLVHYWKDGSVARSPWVRGQTFGTGVTSGPSFIQSSLKAPGAIHGNFEVVVREGNSLVHYWHDNRNPANPWARGATIATTATGGGSIYQSSITPAPGAPGNFEVVFQEGGQVAHYWHDNRNPNNPWARAGAFASGVTGAPSMIQSTFGTELGHPGNLEAIVRQGSQLRHWFKGNGPGGSPWQPGQFIPYGVNSAGSIIQSTMKAPGAIHGNFEVVALSGAAPGLPDSVVEGGVVDYTLSHFFHENNNPANAWGRGQAVTYRGRSEKICQLTGGADRETFAPTRNDTAGRFDLGKTDLGYPVDDGSTLKLYFGDSRNRAGGGLPSEWGWDDTVGISTQTTLPNPIDCVGMTVPISGQTFATLRVNQLPTPPNMRLFQGLFNVPASGFTVGSTAYTTFWTNHCPFVAGQPCPNRSGTLDEVNAFGRGTLTRNTGTTTFQELFSLPPNFRYTAALNSTTVAGIPANQRLGVYVWGVPGYRGTVPLAEGGYPRLAYVPTGQVENPAAWRYLSGRDANEAPIWTTNPNVPPMFSADDPTPPPQNPVLNTGCVGEFSVSWEAPLGRWLMLYNCQTPGRAAGEVRARFATAPWGPWSAPTEIFYPETDKAWCRYMHNDGRIADCIDESGGDNFDDVGQAPGTPYAPYALSRYTRATPQGAEIYYLLSTWNPYQVVVMRANLRLSP